ncbi:MAG: putative rane protein [Microbacteriaceae bacterium]|nr:putative rane protein [Microbacteriaceae bacterium]
MLALAAGLWLVYLVPTWLKRREYLATERNAVRLQQTLRILAESAEVPVAVRAETTARSVAALQRSLLKQEQLAEAVERARETAVSRAATRQLAQAQPALAAVVASRSTASRRLRRTRVAASAVLFASLATLVVQVSLLLTSGLAAGTIAVVAFSAIGGITSLAMLGRLATVSRARAAAFAQPGARVAARPSAPVVHQHQQQPVVETAKPWTPVPLPKPLYLSKPAPQPVVIVADEVAAELRAAAARAERELRAARAAAAKPPVEPIPISRPSRFAAMGIVDAGQTATPDLDAVLRRRRTAS